MMGHAVSLQGMLLCQSHAFWLLLLVLTDWLVFPSVPAFALTSAR